MSVPELLTVQEVTALLRIARITVYRLVSRGEIPTVRMTPGGKIWVPSGRLLRWLDESRIIPFPEVSTWDRGLLLTVPEIAAAARLARSTVHHHVRAGDLECLSLGKSGELFRVWEDSARRFLGSVPP
jgi:excisionase family DNA binding protein